MKGRGLKNGLAVLAAGCLLVLAVGWYQDWYRVERAASAPGFYNLHVGIHTDKVTTDVNRASDQIQQGGRWIQAKCEDIGSKKKPAEPAPKSQPRSFDPVEESSHTPPTAEPVPNKWK
jgi:hypothetical protein